MTPPTPVRAEVANTIHEWEVRQYERPFAVQMDRSRGLDGGSLLNRSDLIDMLTATLTRLLDQARREEREACANVVEQEFLDQRDVGRNWLGAKIAKKIRTRPSDQEAEQAIQKSFCWTCGSHEVFCGAWHLTWRSVRIGGLVLGLAWLLWWRYG